MKHTIAILIILLPLILGGAQTAPGGCTVAGSDLAAAVASATVCLEIPAGDYTLSGSGGVLLQTSAPNLDIGGAGIGQTVIHVTGGVALTQDLIALRLLGAGQRVHDLTIAFGTGYAGPWGTGGISVYTPAERVTIERVEITGGYSGDGARGYGIATYQPYNVQGGAQYVTVRDSWIHDGGTSGMVINSSNNTIDNNHVAGVGTNGLSHGLYMQGGYNLVEDNTIEGVTGWSIHGYKQVPNIDASGDRYIGNTSINPGLGHVIVNGPLTRSATIAQNVFRNTAGRRNTNAVWCNGVPCLIQGNTLEDVFVTTGAGWIDDSGGSVIEGNTLTTTGTPPDGPINFAGIRTIGTGAVISNNTLTLNLGAGIAVMGNDAIVQSNQIRVSGSAIGLTLRGDGGVIQSNRITSTGSGAALIFTLSGPTNLLMTGNYLRRTTGALFSLNLAGVTGRISGNMYDGSYTFSNAAPGVVQ